ncbi:MAG: transposase, partial [Moorella sp. (in: Bacteria)]|nr:transposase [Moorella sp. (in: firmicutes)]
MDNHSHIARQGIRQEDHRPAFWYLGGAPREVLVDNAKQLIVEHPRKGEVVLNQKFQELAGLYCFRPRPCQLYRARTKGKVERPFYVIEEHFIKGNAFGCFADLLQKAKAFNEEWNQKVHTTTLKEPIVLFLLK